MTGFRRSSQQPSGKIRLGQSGQIVVEYMLLLAIAVIVAAIITRMMISRNADNPGFVMSAWRDVIQAIGNDKADDIAR